MQMQSQNFFASTKTASKELRLFPGRISYHPNPTVAVVIHPPCQVPEALQQPLKKELDVLIEQGEISKVDKPTDWVNTLVCVTKSNSTIRLCLDPKDLNSAITTAPQH